MSGSQAIVDSERAKRRVMSLRQYEFGGLDVMRGDEYVRFGDSGPGSRKRRIARQRGLIMLDRTREAVISSLVPVEASFEKEMVRFDVVCRRGSGWGLQDARANGCGDRSGEFVLQLEDVAGAALPSLPPKDETRPPR